MACGECGLDGHNKRTCPLVVSRGSKAASRSSQSSSARRPAPDVRRSSTGQHCGNCGEYGHNQRTCERRQTSRPREEPRRLNGTTRICGIARCVEVSARDMGRFWETNQVGLRALRSEFGNREMSTGAVWAALRARGYGNGFSETVNAQMDHMHAQARGGSNRLSNYCAMPGAINGSLGALPKRDPVKRRVLAQCGCA